MNIRREILKYCCCIFIFSQFEKINYFNNLIKDKSYIKQSKNYYWLLSSSDE
jgi:hypothetical protein